MISYVLVLIVSVSTGRTTQALLEGPMSRSWCEQLIQQDRYRGEDGSIRRSPLCLSGQEASQMLAASACTRTPGPSPRWPTLQFDCAAAGEPAAAPARMPHEEDVAVPVPAQEEDAVVVESDAPGDPAAPPAVVAPPPAPEPVVPAPRARSSFHLGTAASALVAQARTQAAAGQYATAAATIERALHIEQGNPLLWIELGRVRMAEGNAAQAEGLYRKALTLAAGDGETEGMTWGLIAESLRVRGRNQEAAEAERHIAQGAPY